METEIIRLQEENRLLKSLLITANQELRSYQQKYPNPIKGSHIERTDTLTPLLESYEKCNFIYLVLMTVYVESFKICNAVSQLSRSCKALTKGNY